MNLKEESREIEETIGKLLCNDQSLPSETKTKVDANEKKNGTKKGALSKIKDRFKKKENDKNIQESVNQPINTTVNLTAEPEKPKETLEKDLQTNIIVPKIIDILLLEDKLKFNDDESTEDEKFQENKENKSSVHNNINNKPEEILKENINEIKNPPEITIIEENNVQSLKVEFTNEEQPKNQNNNINETEKTNEILNTQEELKENINEGNIVKIQENVTEKQEHKEENQTVGKENIVIEKSKNEHIQNEKINNDIKQTEELIITKDEEQRNKFNDISISPISVNSKNCIKFDNIILEKSVEPSPLKEQQINKINDVKNEDDKDIIKDQYLDTFDINKIEQVKQNESIQEIQEKKEQENICNTKSNKIKENKISPSEQETKETTEVIKNITQVEIKETKEETKNVSKKENNINIKEKENEIKPLEINPKKKSEIEEKKSILKVHPKEGTKKVIINPIKPEKTDINKLKINKEEKKEENEEKKLVQSEIKPLEQGKKCSLNPEKLREIEEKSKNREKTCFFQKIPHNENNKKPLSKAKQKREYLAKTPKIERAKAIPKTAQRITNQNNKIKTKQNPSTFKDKLNDNENKINKTPMPLTPLPEQMGKKTSIIKRRIYSPSILNTDFKTVQSRAITPNCGPPETKREPKKRATSKSLSKHKNIIFETKQEDNKIKKKHNVSNNKIVLQEINSNFFKRQQLFEKKCKEKRDNLEDELKQKEMKEYEQNVLNLRTERPRTKYKSRTIINTSTKIDKLKHEQFITEQKVLKDLNKKFKRENNDIIENNNKTIYFEHVKMPIYNKNKNDRTPHVMLTVRDGKIHSYQNKMEKIEKVKPNQIIQSHKLYMKQKYVENSKLLKKSKNKHLNLSVDNQNKTINDEHKKVKQLQKSKMNQKFNKTFNEDKLIES